METTEAVDNKEAKNRLIVMRKIEGVHGAGQYCVSRRDCLEIAPSDHFQ